MMRTKRIWMISDTHGIHDRLIVPPNIDIVMHGGDGSNSRNFIINEPEYRKFLDWYGNLYIKHKLVIGGNHDTALEMGMFESYDGITVLYNELVVIDGLRVWGSPYSPRFGNWAFMLNRYSPKLKSVWDMIPPRVDILMTHSPPHGILDNTGYEHVGCELLADRLKDVEVGVHMFGHIHEQAGQLSFSRYDSTLYVNAAVITHDHHDMNHGVVLNYEYFADDE